MNVAAGARMRGPVSRGRAARPFKNGRRASTASLRIGESPRPGAGRTESPLAQTLNCPLKRGSFISRFGVTIYICHCDSLISWWDFKSPPGLNHYSLAGIRLIQSASVHDVALPPRRDHSNADEKLAFVVVLRTSVDADVGDWLHLTFLSLRHLCAGARWPGPSREIGSPGASSY